ncbi:hypothetical protein FF011L_35120 [Roseimaritima multifibrata]|uniref:Uncharacterized protein n=1 Tax=Roseimaritima multifibrata TaxID=1930274 RepID=A0A517MIL2_9BACT|nr:hypothetical protein FF011L_35120 [Roseimaritima multifibrata]
MRADHTLFKKMESLVAETIHQDFLSSWVDYRKDFVAAATNYAASDIASLIRDVANHRPTAYGVDRKTRSAKRAELKERFENDVIEMKDESVAARRRCSCEEAGTQQNPSAKFPSRHTQHPCVCRLD